jgi:hypothetical protein
MERRERTGAEGASGGPDTSQAPDRPREDCLAALEKARERLQGRGPVDIRLLRRSVGDEVSRLVFDECLLRLEREGALSLTPHARPERLDALELRDCVPSPRGPLYFVTWRA